MYPLGGCSLIYVGFARLIQDTTDSPHASQPSPSRLNLRPQLPIPHLISQLVPYDELQVRSDLSE